jgi:hypothetical protein
MFSEASPTPAGTADLAAIYLDQHTGALLREPARGPRTMGDVIMKRVAPHVVGPGYNRDRASVLLSMLRPHVDF